MSIDNVTISSIKTDSVEISWNSTVSGTSQIEYGISTLYGNVTQTDDISFYHLHTINPLSEGTVYYFRIKTKDTNNIETTSIDYTFTTKTMAELESTIRTSRIDNSLPKTYYVKVGGNDSLDGQSITNAWGSIITSVSKLDIGDTLYVLEGTWNELSITFDKSGIDVAPITLKSYTNIKPVLIGSSIYIRNKSYINIDNLYIQNSIGVGVTISNYSHHIIVSNVIVDAPGEGIPDVAVGIHNANGVHDIIINNCRVNNGGWNGIMVFGSDYPSHGYISCYNIILKNNEVYNQLTHNAIDIHTNNHHINLIGNIVHDNSGQNGIFVHSVQSPNRYITANNNTVYNSGSGISFWCSQDCYASKNITYNNGRGIYLWGGSEEGVIVPSYNIFLEGNISYGNLYNIDLNAYNGTILNNCTLRNNEVRDSTHTYKIDIMKSISTENLVLQNTNIISNNRVGLYGTITNFQFEYLNGKVFKAVKGGVSTYSTHTSEKSYVLSSGGGLFELFLYPVTAIPVSSNASVNITQFNTTLPIGNILISFTVTSTDNVDFNIQTLKNSTTYILKKSGITIVSTTSSNDGKISFNIPSGVYTIEESPSTCPTPICSITIIQI